ncbi:MAG: DUF882 domain-containing protein [Eubacteriaceae bacterium]|nr:DUF882 domain-containing protein [Eubacteriaceae bacterium]
MLSNKTLKLIQEKLSKLGYNKDKIKAVQIKLNKLGYKLAVDGIAGVKTISAVLAVQKKYKLVQDGICGPVTNACLNKVIASITPPKYVMDWSKYEHFKKEEFVCGCLKPNHKKYCNGYPVEVQAKLMDALMMIRTHFNKPVNITSGVRCVKFNASLKGSSPLSLHLTGGAADFYVSDTNIKDVIAYCVKLKGMGYIRYFYTNSTNMNGAVHINI